MHVSRLQGCAGPASQISRGLLHGPEVYGIGTHDAQHKAGMLAVDRARYMDIRVSVVHCKGLCGMLRAIY